MLQRCQSKALFKIFQELCKVPKLVVEGVTNDDLNEGEIIKLMVCYSVCQSKALFKLLQELCKVPKLVVEGVTTMI